MEDDALSQHIRGVRGLHPDWRVYRYEVVGDSSVRLTGAIARPATEHDNRAVGRPVWFKPMKDKVQMTLPIEKYREIIASEAHA